MSHDLDRNKSPLHAWFFDLIFKKGRMAAHRFAARIDTPQHYCRTREEVVAEEQDFMMDEYSGWLGFLYSHYDLPYKLGFAMGIRDIAEQDAENGRCRMKLFPTLGYRRSWRLAITELHQRGFSNPDLDKIYDEMEPE